MGVQKFEGKRWKIELNKWKEILLLPKIVFRASLPIIEMSDFIRKTNQTKVWRVVESLHTLTKESYHFVIMNSDKAEFAQVVIFFADRFNSLRNSISKKVRNRNNCCINF